MNRRRPVDPPRIDALKRIEADPNLLALYQATTLAVNQGAGAVLQSLIELGRRGCAIAANRGRTDAYETLALLATASGGKGKTFGQAMRLVQTFPSEQLDSFLTRRSVTGDQITLAHVRVLMAAPSAALRNHLIEYFYRRSPTASTLRAESTRQQGRPKIVKPRVASMAGAVARLRSMAQIFRCTLEDDLDDVLFARLRDFAAGKGEPGPTDLSQVADLHAHLSALLPAVADALDTVGRAEAALEARRAAAT